MLIFFIILKNVKICFNPSINLVRIFSYYIDLRKNNAHVMENGTRFFYKLMLLFNSKIRKYEDEFLKSI